MVSKELVSVYFILFLVHLNICPGKVTINTNQDSNEFGRLTIIFLPCREASDSDFEDGLSQDDPIRSRCTARTHSMPNPKPSQRGSPTVDTSRKVGKKEKRLRRGGYTVQFPEVYAQRHQRASLIGSHGGESHPARGQKTASR